MNAELSVKLRTRMGGTNKSRELYQVVEGLQVQPELQAGVSCQHAWRQGVCQVDCLSNVPCPSHQCASVQECLALCPVMHMQLSMCCEMLTLQRNRCSSGRKTHWMSRMCLAAAWRVLYAAMLHWH